MGDRPCPTFSARTHVTASLTASASHWLSVAMVKNRVAAWARFYCPPSMMLATRTSSSSKCAAGWPHR